MKKYKKRTLFILITFVFLTFAIILVIFKVSTSISRKNSNDPTTKDTSNLSYYNSLYGTWSITKHIPSNIKTNLSESVISFCIGQKLTIEKNKISSLYGTVYDPTITEGIINASDFFKKYNDTFINLGIPGNELKFIKITEADKSNHSVTLFITNEEKVYALLSGALFELERQ